MVDDYTLDKVLDKIRRIGIEKLENITNLTDTDGIFPDKITLKNAVILMKYVIKDGDKSYPQLFLEETLCDE